METIYDKQFAFTLDGDNALIIDIGAHIGGFCVLEGSRKPEAKIIAYEPFFENFQILEKNIRLNNLTNIISIMTAVASEISTRKFYMNPINTSAHSLNKKSDKSTEVPCITLDAIILDNQIERCSLLKMDTEGAEYEIILNASDETLKKIDNIIMEYHVPEFFGLDDNNLLSRLVSRLEDSDFIVTQNAENYERGYIRASRI